jgi:hypothetical protein
LSHDTNNHLHLQCNEHISTAAHGDSPRSAERKIAVAAETPRSFLRIEEIAANRAVVGTAAQAQQSAEAPVNWPSAWTTVAPTSETCSSSHLEPLPPPTAG